MPGDEGPLRCAGCGEDRLPARSRFCLRCGASLAAGPGETATEAAYTPEHLAQGPLVVADAQGGERKEVTVLLADVADSLALAETLDVEDVHAVMNGFFEHALRAVHAEGGTVNQFRGDGFMALFGAPRARGDHPARALRAALDVRDATRAYGDLVLAKHGVPFEVRIGLSTGLVWVGAIGDRLRQDYTAEGRTVGLAARLEALARPGQILSCETTAKRGGSGFEFRDRGAHRLRGLAAPVQVYELVARRGGGGGRLAAASGGGGLAPFVGRRAELARLVDALRPQRGLACVEVRGEAGVGKSRLLLEAVGLRGDLALLELGCADSTAQRAYLPWLERLRRWPSGLAGGDAAAELALQLEGRIDAATDPAAVARRTRDLLAQAAAASGLVVAIDDAHWLDPSSRALVRALTAEAPAGSLTFVATVREGEDDDWGAATRVERIRLEPLAEDDARRLALALLDGVEDPEPLADAACLRGGGNPLYVEEIARALREVGEPVREAARLEAALRRAPEQLPGTLHGVVSARIDALSERGKRLAEAAAVLGQPCDVDLLREVEPLLEADPAAVLGELVERGILRAAGDGRYAFRHGVLREGAYAQLVRERRASLHRRAAGALAKRPEASSPDGASRIGDHCDRAGDREAAARHLSAAGMGYAALRSFAEAVVHLRRALALVRSRAERPAGLEASIGLALASALGLLDRTGEAAAVLERVEPGGAPADRARLAMAQVQGGWIHFSNEGDLARGVALIERGLALARATPGCDDAELSGCLYLARIHTLDAALPQALAAAQRAVELGMGRADPVALALGRYNESAVHYEAGRVVDAQRAASQAVSLARERPHDLVVGAAYVAAARAKLLAGDPDSAIAAAARAAEASARANQVGLHYQAVVARAYALLLHGAPRAALDAFESLRGIDDRWPSTALNRARGRLEVGDLDEAAALAERALAAGAPRGISVRALAVRGAALGLGAGPADEGEALLGEASNLCEELGLRPVLAETLGFLAEVCARRGDARRAAHYAVRARGVYASCGMHAHAERARLDA